MKKLFLVTTLIQIENDMAKTIKTEVENIEDNIPSKADRIIGSLKEQLAISEEEMKGYSSNSFTMDEELKREAIIAQRLYYRLKAIVKSVERL
jgi:hypothetical protein